VVLPQVLSIMHEYETMVLGLVIMGFMILLRHGVVPTLAARLGVRWT
jgi:branched-chain amino acid transport system permease protein